MNNWRTNLGGAISVTGTGLIGIGVLSQLSQLSPKTQMLSPAQLTVMWYVALAGFVMSCIGKGVTALFSADAKTVQTTQTQIAELQLRSNIVPNAIESGDTSMLRKATITPSTVVPPSAPVAEPVKVP